jgi:nucleoside-diphosphate-sugar epimerase
MRVLVTGASGFIGRRAVAALAEQGRFELVTACRSASQTLPSQAIHHAIDLLAPGAAAELVARVRPTHLLHLAWNAEPGRFWTASDNLDWAAATITLLRAFLDAGGVRAVLAGSCAEYDWDGGGCLTEEAAIRPATLYGSAKDATRRLACAANDHLGGSVAWGRVFWLYGPAEARGRLVSDVASALATGRPASVGEGRLERDFLHVDDVASAFVAALDGRWRGPFNIGSGEPVSVRRVVATLAQASGRPELVRFGARPARAADPPSIYADTRILRDEFGWTQSVALDTGLAATYAWWETQARVHHSAMPAHR